MHAKKQLRLPNENRLTSASSPDSERLVLHSSSARRRLSTPAPVCALHVWTAVCQFRLRWRWKDIMLWNWAAAWAAASLVGPSALLTATTSATSVMPRLIICSSSPPTGGATCKPEQFLSPPKIQLHGDRCTIDRHHGGAKTDQEQAVDQIRNSHFALADPHGFYKNPRETSRLADQRGVGRCTRNAAQSSPGRRRSNKSIWEGAQPSCRGSSSHEPSLLHYCSCP